jgi:hypothetical protein
MGDHLDEQALGGTAGLNHPALGKRALTGVEVKPRLPLPLVRTVAGKAVVGEDREDLPGETDRRAARRVLRPHPLDGHAHDDRDTCSREKGRANVAGHVQASYCHRIRVGRDAGRPTIS